MIVWTVQPYSVYQQLQQQQIFSCDLRQSQNLQVEEFRVAYSWMIKQMIKQIGLPPAGVTHPIWAWYRWDFQHKHPDFRTMRDYDDQVCLELEMPDEQALLSDFDAWHTVLNDFYNSCVTNEEEFEAEFAWFENLPLKQQEQVKRKSWQHIFDVTPRRGKWTQNGDFVQACFWQIHMHQVRKVWRMKRGRKVTLMTPSSF